MKRDNKNNYEALCKEILDGIGGVENISDVFHCVTRLRIVPKNQELVNMDQLQRIKGIIKVLQSSGQIQCVIGGEVTNVYEEFVQMTNLKKDDASELPQGVTERKPNILMKGLMTLAACVTPGLYAIVSGGMIKGIVSLITAFGWLDSSSDIITIMNAVGDAPFYFMPFIIGYASAKRFKVQEVFGIMIAGILMYSTFSSPVEGITGYHYLFFNIPAYNYKNTIFPVVLSVWLFSVVFHLVDKHMPKNVRTAFSGAVSFIISAPLFLAFLAPLGNFIANTLVTRFSWLFENVGPFAGALFCGIIPLTIIFGIKGWSAIELANLETLGYDYMLPNFFYSNCAVSGALLGRAVKMKKSEEKSAMISTGLVCILGITEPALYGYALPEKKPLFSCMIGGAIAGALAMILHVVTYAFSMPGITSIATYMDTGNNFVKLLLVMAVAWISSFCISFFITEGKEE